MRWWLVCALLVWTSPPARAGESVDVALALVTDVSRSIDDSEYDLEKQGYAAAFTSPEVIAAIQGGAVGSLAVTYIEFAGSYEVKTLIGWTVIRDAAGAKAFVDQLTALPRSAYGRTAIGSGVEAAMRSLASSGLEAQRNVIDVCGDGTNNNGRDVASVRDEAVAAGITINGLAIINDHPVSWTFAHVQPPGGLANYYRENVAGGPGTFVLEVHDFKTFGEAMTRKLINEIARRDDARARYAALSAAGASARDRTPAAGR
jgi:hypothetical protein